MPVLQSSWKTRSEQSVDERNSLPRRQAISGSVYPASSSLLSLGERARRNRGQQTLSQRRPLGSEPCFHPGNLSSRGSFRDMHCLRGRQGSCERRSAIIAGVHELGSRVSRRQSALAAGFQRLASAEDVGNAFKHGERHCFGKG